MTYPVIPVPQNDTIFQAIRDVLVATNLFGARIWMTGQVPTSTPTFPFASIQPLGGVGPVQGSSGMASADGGRMLWLQQQIQVDIWQRDLRDQDMTLPGNAVRALQTIQTDVSGARVQLRFLSVFDIPTPEDETALHQAITLIAYHPVEAL